MTTLSASPASLEVLSPYDASEGLTHTSFYQPLPELESLTNESQHPPSTNSPTSQYISTQTPDKAHASAPCSQPFATITEIGLSSSGLGFTPLNSTLASRVASMSQLVACTAETDLGKDVCDQYERSKRPSHDYTAPRRNRAFSAPEGMMNPVNLNLNMQNKPLRTEQPGAEVGPTHPITCNKPRSKPTMQEWVSDLDCVSGVLGAMFADDDRGAR
jgi:hypothetical protein